MLQTLVNAWKTPDLRKKLLFTAFVLLIYRFGSFIPSPGVDSSALASALSNQGGIYSLLSVFSGGGLSRLSLFALGIMPYITASIILQVLTPVSANLQALQKEGELGQRKITQYTRYLTVVLAALQGLGYTYAFHSGALGTTGTGNLVKFNLGNVILVTMTLTVGATLLMWLGELVTQRGIGNGMSLLIFASILTSAPAAINAWWNGSAFEKLSLPIVIFLVVLAVVYVQEGIRKIPIQYAKRMVGRRMTSGGSTYLPLRINMAGVIPVIFAAAIMAFPATVGQLLPFGFANSVAAFFSPGGWPFLIGEAVLIFAFTFFYVAVVFNSDRAGRQPQEGQRVHPRHPARAAHCAVPRVGAGAADRRRRRVPGRGGRRAVDLHQVRRVLAGHVACSGRHLGADRRGRRDRHDAPDRGAAGPALLPGLLEVIPCRSI